MEEITQTVYLCDKDELILCFPEDYSEYEFSNIIPNTGDYVQLPTYEKNSSKNKRCKVLYRFFDHYYKDCYVVLDI